MKVEIVREQPVNPPIREYIVTLTPEEAVLLRSLQAIYRGLEGA